ncbi:MAG: 2-keto-4-pentenoate hydratase [Reyranellaceae bacterium]
MTAFDPDKTAAFVADLRRQPRVVRPWPAEHLPPDEDSAYGVQRRVIAATGRPIAGWKVGLTSPAIRAQTGLSEPICGPVLAGAVHASPHQVRAESFGRLGIELEIALLLGADLPAAGAPYSTATVAAAVAAAATAFELIDDRGADYARLDAKQLIVDGAWQAGVVIGRPVAMESRPELEHGSGSLSVDGKPIAAAPANAGMGHCFNVLAWLANRLARDGAGLRADMLVMTGSIVAAYFPRPGETLAGEIAGMDAISLKIL